MWDAEGELRQIWEAAIAAVDPLNVVARHLPPRPKGRLVIVGAGKAAARMAAAAEAHYGAPLEGLVLTVHGYEQPLRHLQLVTGGHPVPDESGRNAADRILALAHALTRNDLLLVLLSGGASALLSLPIVGVPFADVQVLTRALLASGAPISALNTVRKHLSRIKGGRLASAAYPARTVTLAISDVPGDKPSVIASGPTVADMTTTADARAALKQYGVVPLPSVEAALNDPRSQTIKPWNRRIWRSQYCLVARPADALNAARACAGALGYSVIDLGEHLEGEASAVARMHADVARRRVKTKTAFLSGGELTVTGAGGETAGGRCREYALALEEALGIRSDVAALAADTDGIDGSKEAAGAFVLPRDFEASVQAGRDPREFLKAHRSGDYFAALGRQLVTGPTYTNVGDFRVILVNPAA